MQRLFRKRNRDLLATRFSILQAHRVRFYDAGTQWQGGLVGYGEEEELSDEEAADIAEDHLGELEN